MSPFNSSCINVSYSGTPRSALNPQIRPPVTPPLTQYSFQCCDFNFPLSLACRGKDKRRHRSPRGLYPPPQYEAFRLLAARQEMGCRSEPNLPDGTDNPLLFLTVPLRWLNPILPSPPTHGACGPSSRERVCYGHTERHKLFFFFFKLQFCESDLMRMTEHRGEGKTQSDEPFPCCVPAHFLSDGGRATRILTGHLTGSKD